MIALKGWIYHPTDKRRLLGKYQRGNWGKVLQGCSENLGKFLQGCSANWGKVIQGCSEHWGKAYMDIVKTGGKSWMDVVKTARRDRRENWVAVRFVTVSLEGYFRGKTALVIT